ncbi:zinc ribbon domain-containing protein [Lewinella sp. LCG006]|uniref:zinc ribbon domain-containing protein n=1 Tax=Lewinella sp. LCG006 TaxID=3231911 RepID=UPI00345F6F20
MKICPNCQTSLPPEARFCHQCGALQLPSLERAAAPGWDWQAPLVPQAFSRFQERLGERVVCEQNEAQLPQYQERLYESNYRETVQRRLQQWEKSIAIPLDKSDQHRVLHELRHLSDDLLDFFFIMHCSDLNRVVLPELLLRYQQLPLEEINLGEMAMTFLDFEHEEERVYTDFVKMPVNKIRNAGKAFLFPEKAEKIWFICDQSLLGNAKKGFAMTEKALYWKSGLQPAQRVYYHKLFALTKEKEWLLINELYFNASPSLNTKMIWLLRRLARLLSAEL